MQKHKEVYKVCYLVKIVVVYLKLEDLLVEMEEHLQVLCARL